jgi:hypothetical protein
MKPIQKLNRKPPVEFTAERKEQFLSEYRASGLVYLSAEACGISERTVNEHCKQDPAFAEAFEAAKQAWIDEVLVKEAVRRATQGVRRPIIGGRFKDEVVAEEQVYSDSLMSQLLKAKRGEFRAGEGGAEGGGGGGVLMVPAAPLTMDDWETAFGELARGQSGREPEPEDAE